MMRLLELFAQWQITEIGVRRIYLGGLGIAGKRMTILDLKSIRRIAEVLAKHDVEYMFIGKFAAILHGYSDTTQDIDLFVRKDRENRKRLLQAVSELGFELDEQQKAEVFVAAFVQFRQSPFDLDLIFEPEGIGKYDEARKRVVQVDAFPVAGLTDVIKSKQAADRVKDREVMRRLLSFTDYLEARKK